MAYSTRKAVIGSGILASALLFAAGAVAQQPQDASDTRRWHNDRAQATLYANINYNGTAQELQQDTPNLRTPFRARSIRVQSGRWELCDQANYRGNCQTVDADTPLIGNLIRGLTVASARAVRDDRYPTPNPGSEQHSLRGSQAEFFPAPTRMGQRVAACDRGNATQVCATRMANNFCTSIGWQRAANASFETLRRQSYLADVLCTGRYTGPTPPR